MEEDQVGEHLNKPNIYRLMGPDRMYPQVQRELANITVMPLLIICERSWRLGEVPDNKKKVIISSVFQKGKEEDWGATGLSASPQSLKRR